MQPSSNNDPIRIKETAEVMSIEPKILEQEEYIPAWKTHTRIDKWNPDGSFDETVEVEGNIAVIGGISALIHRLIGGTAVGPFDSATAAIGVGDSTTAAANTQIDLQATTNKFRKAMDASYPQHTDSTGNDSSRTITFRATFAASEANYAWNEWAIFNSVATSGSGLNRMLNRKVESLGTKVSGAVWQITLTLTLA